VFLQLNQISKIFSARDRSGEVIAVDNVQVQIERGQFITLLGPSGCGKTTTLRLIAGFEFPTSGQIVLDGQMINELPPNRRDMAMVFQSYAIFPHLDVFDNIAYGLRVQKLSNDAIKRQVAVATALTELEGLEHRAPNQLSGGQQQRVALARALVMKPKVLLFDEPLSNLDAKLRVQMRSEIRRIQQELDITSVYVTHDQDEAMVLSDQIVVMHQGRVQQMGSALEIYRRPVNAFVADFIGRANFLPVTILDRASEYWTIQLLDIRLPVLSSMHAMVHSPDALLLVRPESIRIHTSPPAGSPSIAALVRRTLYLGAQAEYELSIGDLHLLVVRHDPRAQDIYEPDTHVYLEFLTENLFLLPSKSG
jgi:iron(III) transport system ATP-binding protein